MRQRLAPSAKLSEAAKSLIRAIASGDSEVAERWVSELLLNAQPMFPGFQRPATEDEAVRQVVGALRIAADTVSVPYKVVISAYGRHPDLYRIAKIMATPDGRNGLEQLSPTPFLPVLPAMAQRYKNPKDAWRRTKGGKWLVEPKLDGWECQIHISKGQVRLFGRSGREWTSLAPTVVAEVSRRLVSYEVILETELLAVDPKTDHVLPRTEIQRPGVNHRAVVFDLLYLDGDFTRLPCQERRRRLEDLLSAPGKHMTLTEQYEVSDYRGFDQLFQTWVTQGLEGMIAKRPDAIYEANQRTTNRIKIKPKDTVDAVILGYAESPRAYLVAIWDGDQDGFVPFAWVTSLKKGVSLDAIITDTEDRSLPPISVGERTTYMRLRPTFVVEVEGDHIFPSVDFPCGEYQTGQGWSLWSPTISDLRPDKSPNDATTVEEFIELPRMAGQGKPKKRKTPQPKQPRLLE